MHRPIFAALWLVAAATAGAFTVDGTVEVARATTAARAGTAPAGDAESPCPLEHPCRVDGGEYALVTPARWDGRSPIPALVFFHGYSASMASTVRSTSLRRAFVDEGWLLVAPQGERAAPGSPRRWPGYPDAGWRDDRGFVLELLADVAARVPLAGEPVLAGYSSGGSMAWMMSCYEGARFAAVISLAGALRRPNAEPCPQMVTRALHIHGFADRTVPLEGRPIRDWHQGSVARTLEGFRQANRCRSHPDGIETQGDWRRRHWTRCADGAELLYLEHDGGHGPPPGWADVASDWIEAR